MFLLRLHRPPSIQLRELSTRRPQGTVNAAIITDVRRPIPLKLSLDLPESEQRSAQLPEAAKARLSEPSLEERAALRMIG